MDSYNVCLQNQGADEEEIVRVIFRQIRSVFKINVALRLVFTSNGVGFGVVVGVVTELTTK